MVTTTINNTNIYEFEVRTGKLAELKEKIESPSMSKEYVDECRRIAEMFRRNGERVDSLKNDKSENNDV